MDNNSPPEFDQYAHNYKKLLNESISASGDESEYFAKYKANYVANSLDEPLKKNLSVLDFGCGVGGCLPHLTSMMPSARVFGVDVSGESIALAKQSNPDAILDQIIGDKIPLPDASIDVAMAACVFHHIPPAQRQHWVDELNRVLKPGGQLFIFEHNPLNPLTRRVVRLCEFDADAILLPRQESLNLLESAGMTNASVNYIVFFPEALSFAQPIERALKWLPLGAQYVAHAKA